MSVQAISWVIENSRHKGSSFVVLLMIANHAHSDGAGAYPSLDTLARESRITVRQVTNIIPLLERSGELHVQRGAGPRGVNLYSVQTRQERLPMENFSNGKPLAPISTEPLEPSMKREEEPSYVRSPLSTSEALVPDWMPMAEWYEFCRLRRAMPKNVPWTPDSVKRTITELWKLKEAGQDPAAVLAQSVQRGWRGVFEVKNGNGETGPQTFAQIGTRRSQAAIRRVASDPPSMAHNLQRALPERAD